MTGQAAMSGLAAMSGQMGGAAMAPRWLDGDVERWIDLPSAAVLGRADWLGDLVGRPVEPLRMRVKPGLSMVVGWRDPDRARGLDAFGWAAVMADPEKVAAVRRRARHVGARLTVDEPVGRGRASAVLLAGGIGSDPGIARELAHARRRLPSTAVAQVLAYNPGKRVVAAVEVGPARRVVRVGAERQHHLVAAVNRWRAHGAPVLPVRALGRRGTAVESPWWGEGDLGRIGGAEQARAVGQVIAEVHRASAVRGGASQLAPVEIDDLAAVLPEQRDRITALAALIEQRVAEAEAYGSMAGRAHTGLVHGDLSPDQVLVDEHGAIRLIDLDRATTGPGGTDVGSWLASGEEVGRTDLTQGFLAGWADVGAEVAVDVDLWRARAVLARVGEPFRQLRPDWRAQVVAGLDRVESLLVHGGDR
ncbi:MAG TPA: phosphotransferase [Candidatus Avipropionibacterium avicola]|uniref:Phosphotransferase n=1 Tax=Candidatus Avipropionibacterium avicola TaxID=2840701 RepID=A0A9D1GWJ9_9ACTN|nr:phosphotransferase [Candidatus Avipropionibacterium avicola]